MYNAPVQNALQLRLGQADAEPFEQIQYLVLTNSCQLFMQALVLLALALLLTRQTLIGFISIPESRLASLHRTDPGFALTAARIGAVFEDHCDIPLRQTISVAYRIVEGVKYNIVFDTKYGPVNAIAATKFWEKSVEVIDIKFLDPINKNNMDSSSKGTLSQAGSSSVATGSVAGPQLLPNSLAQSRENRGTLPVQTVFKFPTVRQKCELMRQQLETLQGEQQADPDVTTELLQKALTPPLAASGSNILPLSPSTKSSPSSGTSSAATTNSSTTTAVAPPSSPVSSSPLSASGAPTISTSSGAPTPVTESAPVSPTATPPASSSLPDSNNPTPNTVTPAPSLSTPTSSSTSSVPTASTASSNTSGSSPPGGSSSTISSAGTAANSTSSRSLPSSLPTASKPSSSFSWPSIGSSITSTISFRSRFLLGLAQ